MTKKSIVFFTVGYPYGKGEIFLEQELKYAEERFERVLIVSCVKKSGKVCQYVPHNASLVSIRDNVSSAHLFAIRLSALFYYRTWAQLFLCLKSRGYKSLISGLKAIILESSQIYMLIKNENIWEHNYEFYYSYWLSGSASYLALRRNRLSGICFSRAHGYDCFFERGFHPFRKEQFDKLDYIFPISHAGKEDLVTQGCDPKKIVVARLGVDNTFNILNPNNGLSKKTLVSCSNIVDLKRLDLIIETLETIDSVKIEWVHFGDGELRSRIEKFASERLSRKPNISYSFKGRVPISSILEFYATKPIDLFINCSDYEGIPVSVMEAMSFGIPCIARDVGGNREIIQNNINGILLPKNPTVQEISSSIINFLNLSNDSVETIRMNAFNQYVSLYDAKRNFPKFWDDVIKTDI